MCVCVCVGGGCWLGVGGVLVRGGGMLVRGAGLREGGITYAQPLHHAHQCVV